MPKKDGELWIGKSKLIHSTLPYKIIINKNVIFEEKHIAIACNNFFINNSYKIFRKLRPKH